MTFRPLTRETWKDLESVFGPRGAVGGCWCMYWRLDAKTWFRKKGNENRKALRNLVARDTAHGIIAYESSLPVGWCAVGPCAEFGRLCHSQIRRAVAQENGEIWSIPCLFIKRGYRRSGLSVALIKRATRFALDHGATCVEAYPKAALEPDTPPPSLFTGTSSAFRAAGFVVVDEPFKNRHVVRLRKKRR